MKKNVIDHVSELTKSGLALPCSDVTLIPKSHFFEDLSIVVSDISGDKISYNLNGPLFTVITSGAININYTTSDLAELKKCLAALEKIASLGKK